MIENIIGRYRKRKTRYRYCGRYFLYNTISTILFSGTGLWSEMNLELDNQLLTVRRSSAVGTMANFYNGDVEYLTSRSHRLSNFLTIAYISLAVLAINFCLYGFLTGRSSSNLAIDLTKYTYSTVRNKINRIRGRENSLTENG